MQVRCLRQAGKIEAYLGYNTIFKGFGGLCAWGAN